VHCSRETYSGDLSEFPFTNNQMAVRRNSLGCLKGFVYVATYVETVDLECIAPKNGRGTASKTCILLEAVLRVSADVAYVPVDVCSNALELACQNIACALPEVRIQPIVPNYVTHPLQLEPFDGTTLALYIGTSIGNFSPEEARLILRDLRVQLQTGDALLLGTDMVKDESTLLAAYDDGDGITAAFNLNILHRLNRELGANFDVARFRHRVLWNSIESRIEMHLESTQEQDVGIEHADLDLNFMPRETIHTENSYKFTHQGISKTSRRDRFRDQRGVERQSRLVHPHACVPPIVLVTMRQSRSASAHWQESRYQSFDDTVVQFFISQASVLMTHVDRIHSKWLQPGIGEGT
jgi:dimethylhistidine N-methyltransferase